MSLMKNCKPIKLRLKMSNIGKSPETIQQEVASEVEVDSDATQVTYALPNLRQFSVTSTQVQRVPFVHKGCMLSMVWQNDDGKSPLVSISGELRTLLAEHLKGKGSVWIDAVTLEVVSQVTTGILACCFTSSSEAPESLADVMVAPNKQYWYFNNATRGIVHTTPLVIPNSVSQQIIPASSDYPSLYFYAVRSAGAAFNFVMRVHYSCTKIVSNGNF